jgi:hypothetical protein
MAEGLFGEDNNIGSDSSISEEQQLVRFLRNIGKSSPGS